MYNLDLMLVFALFYIWLQSQSSPGRQRKLSLAESYNKANIFISLIGYELNSLLSTLHLIDYISVHIRFDLEKYLLYYYIVKGGRGLIEIH